MTRSRLLLAVASVLAGTAALFVVLGATVNLVLLAAAVPFGLAAFMLWFHATGRLEARVRSRAVDARTWARERGRRPGSRARSGDGRAADARAAGWSARVGRGAGRTVGGRTVGGRAASERTAAGRSTGDPGEMDRREALRALGLSPGADEAAVRRAFRERVKAVHPDADSGDEAAFRRLTAAYDRLRER